MIDFLNLNLINKNYEDALLNEFKKFLSSGYYILGDQVKKFEANFAQYCNVKYCIGVGNGLDALTLILKGYIQLGKLKKGDKILVAANTYIATILAIKRVDLIPLLIEPNEYTFNLDPSLLSLKENPKAVLVTHLYGQLAEMDKINSFCKKNNLLLISDAAQAHGAEDEHGNRAGSLADASGFSFYPTKNLGALGDGGAVITNNQELTGYIRKIRNYGFSTKDESEFIGVNSRLDEIQASFLNIKLNYLDEENEKRRNIAKLYIEKINNSKIKKPSWNFSKSHVFHQFVVRIKNRDQFRDYMYKNGVQTMIHYPIPPHKQKALEGCFNETYEITEKLSDEMVSLPVNSIILHEDINKIITIINMF